MPGLEGQGLQQVPQGPYRELPKRGLLLYGRPDAPCVRPDHDLHQLDHDEQLDADHQQLDHDEQLDADHEQLDHDEPDDEHHLDHDRDQHPVLRAGLARGRVHL